MKSYHDEATRPHNEYDPWAQSAEEARLARLRQLETMQGHDSDPSNNGKHPSLTVATQAHTHSFATISKLCYFHGNKHHQSGKPKVQA